MAKVKVTELVAPLYEATRLLTKLKPQPTSALRFTTFCNQPTHVGESKQSDVVYWVDDVDSDDIHVRCKCCGDLTMDMILNPATVEIKPVNESADLDKIKSTNEPVELVNSLPIDEITIDERLQARMEKKPDPQVVTEYAELMRDGVVFPPVVVFYDSLTSTRLLAEGFHRIEAAKQAGFTSISVTVIEGNERAAMLHSLGSNADHGKRRTNADKRYVVETMLKDDQWSAWSDREIGERCKVTHPFVAGIRKSLIPVSLETLPVSEVTKERTFTTKHGTTATMRTGNIGKKQEPVKPTTPSAKLAVASAEPTVIQPPSKPDYDDPSYIKKAQDDASLDSFYKLSEIVASYCNEKNANFLKKLLIEHSDYYGDRWKRPLKRSIANVMTFLDNKHFYMRAFDDVLFDVVPHHIKSDSNDELDKLKCELAYLKSKIRDVYFDKASIRLDEDDAIRFDELPESN